MCGSRLPSACTSRCATSSSTRSTLSSIVGTMTIVRADAGTWSQLDARQPARRNQVADDPLHDLNHQLARGHEREQRHRHERRPVPAAAQPRTPPPRPTSRQVPAAIVARYTGVAHGEEQPPDALPEIRLPGHADARTRGGRRHSDDSPRARARSSGARTCDLPRALDALEREQQLRLAGRPRQLLHGVAVAVAAAEVHPAVHARRIALQHLLDEADALEELAPVERADEAQAGDEVGDGGLLRGLVLAFRRGWRPRSSRRGATAARRADGACSRRCAPRARERTRSRVTNAGCTSAGQALTLRGHRLDRRRQAIGGDAMRPCLGQHVGRARGGDR